MILTNALVGERLPLLDLLGWDDDPLPEALAAAGRIEEMRAGKSERPGTDLRVRELEHHPRAGEAEHDLAGALHARHREHLRGASLVVPGADRVDDVLEACPLLLAIVHVSTIRSPTPGFTLASGVSPRMSSVGVWHS